MENNEFRSSVNYLYLGILKFSYPPVLSTELFFYSLHLQTTSRRLADRKVEKFEKNIKKRGVGIETTKKKGNPYPVGPIVIGFFIFVVIGSCELLPSLILI